MHTTAEFILINGKKTEVAWLEPASPNKPTLIFLHEGLRCVELWRDFPQKVVTATGCGALVYSRVGYGNSDACELPRPVSYMQDEALVGLPALLQNAGIQQYILIGHSDGASIALIHAGTPPRPRLLGVISEAAHVFTEPIGMQAIAAAKEDFLHGELREKMQKYHGKNVDCAFWGWNETWERLAESKWNIESYLPAIQVPLLIIQGEDDPFGSVDQVTAIASQTGGKHELLLIPDCGHNAHKEGEEMILPAMVKFISKVVGR